MADSNITKRALASSLKELMETKPFPKISVSDICEACKMSRKSFYYHFKDKYDLVNWIYYTECVAAIREKEYHTDWDLLEDLCVYFYENRSFYRKTLSVDGQNFFPNICGISLQPLFLRIWKIFLAGRIPLRFTWIFIPTRFSVPSNAGCLTKTVCRLRSLSAC